MAAIAAYVQRRLGGYCIGLVLDHHGCGHELSPYLLPCLAIRRHATPEMAAALLAALIVGVVTLLLHLSFRPKATEEKNGY